MIRLDKLLVDRELFATRSRARDAILRGTIRVDGQIAAKPGQAISPDCVVAVEDPASGYVSRAALKLLAGLDRFGFDPAGMIALDLGASTGGFTEVLLERGARRIYAIDVGHGQLAESLRSEARIVSIEGLNARDLAAGHLEDNRPQFLVSDVSFISLRLALPPALALARPGAQGIFLVKPQFEAGRAAIGKGGILRDATAGETIAASLAEWLAQEQGWEVHGWSASPISGADGNQEYLLAARKPI